MTRRRKSRGVEKTYTTKQLVSKIRRLAKGLSTGRQFVIQIANERIRVPRNAKVNIEHEREGKDEEIEFQIKWRQK